MISVKRIYNAPARSDGYRVLVDRYWPRGVSKATAGIDLWLKDIAPSDELRKWFNHEPQKWGHFRERYFAELEEKQGLLKPIRENLKNGLTLLYSARDEHHNNAVALKEYLEKKWEVGNEKSVG